MLHSIHLCVINVSESRCGTESCKVSVGKTDAADACMKMLLQKRCCLYVIINLIRKLCDDKTETVLDIIGIDAGDHKCLVADYLRGRKSAELIHNILFVAAGSGHKLTCGNVYTGNTKSCSIIKDTHEEVVLCFIQCLLRGQGSRCYDTDNSPFHKPLCKLRILKLLRNGYLIAACGKTCHISVCCMERYTAHRCTFFHSAVLAGEYQIKH